MPALVTEEMSPVEYSTGTGLSVFETAGPDAPRGQAWPDETARCWCGWSAELNSRPRKAPGWETPAGGLAKFLQTAI